MASHHLSESYLKVGDLKLYSAYLKASKPRADIGDKDEVIPDEVISSLEQELKKSAVELNKEILPDATHQIAKWLAAHEVKSRFIVRYLAGGDI